MKKIETLTIPLIVAGSFLSFSAIATENNNNNNSLFKNGAPGQDKPTTEETRGAGGRIGCQYPIASDLVLLSPKNKKIAKTTKAHPTFLLELTAVPPGPLRYSWGELETYERFVYEKFNLDRKGIVAVTIPLGLPEMKFDRDYQMTIGIICNYYRASHDSFEQVRLRRVPEPPSVKAASSPAERIRALMAEGIWYDAILEAYENRENLDSSENEIRQLLQAIDTYNPGMLTAEFSHLNWDNTDTESLE